MLEERPAFPTILSRYRALFRENGRSCPCTRLIQSKFLASPLERSCTNALFLHRFVSHSQFSVSWRKFKKSLGRTLRIRMRSASTETKALRRLLVTEEKDGKGEGGAEVKLERYGMVCRWFGPLKSESSNIVTSILGTMQNQWFHGDIERPGLSSLSFACCSCFQIAETLLARFAPGTFLVRFSSGQESSPFTLSKVTSSVRVHPLFVFSSCVLCVLLIFIPFPTNRRIEFFINGFIPKIRKRGKDILYTSNIHRLMRR